ncbi:ScbR family autoregulator-binding transcription factor [Streptomyces europaeiscabiei]|uniref:ScbR family autoregulator-binding transcription factor n=1 Tax=Streptomyces europaeiscabiei TaxID=146819 RepID=UPI002E28CFDA|nr:ScbR family autoregulator-binding transcription factor [Streptomyces europaeiscabiei]
MLKQERALRTRHSLVRSAAEVFERHGYAQAKLADISAGAAVTPGALHFHFANKAAVAVTVQAAAAEGLRRAARTATRRPGLDPLQRLTDASHALADRLRRDVVARAGSRLSDDEACRAHLDLDLSREWGTCVHGLLTEAERAGLLADGVSRADAIASLVAATTGLEVLGRTDPEWLSRPALTRFWELVLPRLATPEALATLSPGGTRRTGPGTPMPKL